MKVFELMHILKGAKAGADVVMGNPYTLNTHLISVEVVDDSMVQLTSADTALINSKGRQMGMLSDLSAVEAPDE